MKLISFSIDELVQLVEHQIQNLFRFDRKADAPVLHESVLQALARCEKCFSATPNKYYRTDSATMFNPYHSGQYAIFLYYLSRSIFTTHHDVAKSLADRVYYLNRALNAVDLFYEVELPDIFFLDHPVGSVMGRASYGDYFSFAQNCTVGNNKGVYPVIGRHVTMMTGSTVIGKSNVGDHVVLSAGSLVKDADIPSGSLVFGRSPHLVVKSYNQESDQLTS